MLDLIHKVIPSPANYSNPPSVAIDFNAANGVITYTESYPSTSTNIPLSNILVSGISANTIPNVNSDNTVTMTTSAQSWTTSLNVYSLQATNEVADYMFYYVGYQPNSKNPSQAAIHNVFANTNINKNNVASYLAGINQPDIAGLKSYFLVIPVAKEMETWKLLLETPDQITNITITGDFNVTQNNLARVEGNILPWPKLGPIVRSETNNNIIYIPISNAPSNNHVMKLETTHGVLNATKVSGNANVILDITNVTPGSLCKVKVNYQYYTGRANVMIQL
jgi:hypothetical protein